ncbi:hypothetical protein [Umezawaea sp. Da 62-37]|uniref:hypothetical protein n=1 Tax=Umezawaea sp. Da 62-37 TaxID=3075927 RepID=UPI0028F70120|nr:hypothetical protein [Umezawaea sp. Da 62-37]WNV83151.1 hypothetical protein RM788_33875 [Umezawaea sp. Da 62-37]
MSIEINPDTSTASWGPTDHGTADGPGFCTVPWFPSTGVLDYASATHPVAEFRRQDASATTGTSPTYGDPLIVRPDLGAVFHRMGSVLHTTPIRSGRADFTDSVAVEWAAADTDYDRVRVVEHNLAQCSTLPTLDPPLHVLQVEQSGRLSLSFLLADTDGNPVIGPTPHHYQPYLHPGQLETAAGQGLPALAAMWEDALRQRTTDGSWRFVPLEQVHDTLIRLGFTITDSAAKRSGLVGAFGAAAHRQWVPGWYGGTRLLALARFTRAYYGGDLHYDYHAPGSRRVAVASDRHGDLLGMQGPADVEALPRGERVYVRSGFPGGGMATPVEAGRVALHEPVLIDGPLPVFDDQVSWSASCRRCGMPMSCGLVGRWDFLPYVHELGPDDHSTGSWCSAHPVTDRRRPHAPVCRVVVRPDRDVDESPARS